MKMLLPIVLVLALGIAGCQKNERPVAAKKVETSQVVKQEPVTVMSLDKRVTVIEQRNARIDARLNAQRKAVK